MILMLFVITFLWGTTFIFSKILVTVLSPSFIVAVRFLISLLLFTLMFRKRIRFDKGTLTAGAMIGVVNGAALVLQVLGLKYTTASNSAFITAVYIIFVPILEKVFWGKKQNPHTIQGIIMTLAGVFILSYGGGAVNKGDIITFFCGTIYALQIFLISHYCRKHDIYGLVFLQFLFTAATGIVLSLAGGEISDYPRMAASLGDPTMLAHMMLLSVFGTFIPYAFQFYLQKRVTPTLAGLIYISEPVFAMMLSVLFLGEHMTIMKLAGIVVIMAGIFNSIRK